MAELMSDERLAEIRAAFGPASIYLSGVAGDGVMTVGNELLAEIDRLRAPQGTPRVQYGVRQLDGGFVVTAPNEDTARRWARQHANLGATGESVRVQRRTVTRSATDWEDVDG